MSSFKTINLNIPAEADYVMSLRLFVSGIGTVAGFDIDELESMKLVISELLVMAVKDEVGTLNMRFYIRDGEIKCMSNVTVDDRDNLSLKIIEALSEEVIADDAELKVVFKREN